MNYTFEELSTSRISRDMLLNWFTHSFCKKLNKEYDPEEINLEVKINGVAVENPLRLFSEIEDFIDNEINKKCKILMDFDNEVNKIVEKKSKELLEDKVYNLQNQISRWLEEQD